MLSILTVRLRNLYHYWSHTTRHVAILFIHTISMEHLIVAATFLYNSTESHSPISSVVSRSVLRFYAAKHSRLCSSLSFSRARDCERVRERVIGNFIVAWRFFHFWFCGRKKFQRLRPLSLSESIAVEICFVSTVRGLHLNRSSAERGKCWNSDNLVWFCGFGLEMMWHCSCFVVVEAMDFWFLAS